MRIETFKLVKASAVFRQTIDSWKKLGSINCVDYSASVAVAYKSVSGYDETFDKYEMLLDDGTVGWTYVFNCEEITL